MPFEVFTPVRATGGRTSEPMINVRRSTKRITITRAAIDLLPKACTHVVLAFDEDSRQIALLATAATDPKAIRISGTTTKQIGIGSFAEHFAIADGRYPVAHARVHDRGALVSGEVLHADTEGVTA
jgi:hypothetical protein